MLAIAQSSLYWSIASVVSSDSILPWKLLPFISTILTNHSYTYGHSIVLCHDFPGLATFGHEEVFSIRLDQTFSFTLPPLVPVDIVFYYIVQSYSNNHLVLPWCTS